MSSGERKEAESVVKLNNLLQYIADNEIQRNILKLDIKKLRRNGKISETADKVFKGLLSDTFSYVEILREEHLQERRLAFKDQNRIVHEEFLDTWFLRNKNIYRKYDTIDKSLRAGFAGEEVMEKSDLDKLYTPEFIRRLLLRASIKLSDDSANLLTDSVNLSNGLFLNFEKELNRSIITDAFSISTLLMISTVFLKGCIAVTIPFDLSHPSMRLVRPFLMLTDDVSK